MVTRLDGPPTEFLPFNQGNDGAAGNPVNTDGGHRTAYLWEKSGHAKAGWKFWAVISSPDVIKRNRSRK